MVTFPRHAGGRITMRLTQNDSVTVMQTMRRNPSMQNRTILIQCDRALTARVQSWRWLFFSAFFDPTIRGRLAFACFLFFFDHFDWQKLFSNQKKKGNASALPASVAGSSCLSSSKVKNKDRWTTNGIDRTVSVEQTERPSSRKAWIEREGHFPCPAHGTGLWQTFKPLLSFQSRTSKPDNTWTPTSTAWEILRTRCKQSSISFSKDEALRKIKEIFSLCLWPQSFFSFVLSFFFFTFHRRTVELKTDLATRQEKLKISRCTETCIGPTVGAVGPTVGAGWLRRSSSFRNFANFFPGTKLFAPKQSLKTWLFKTPAKT